MTFYCRRPSGTFHESITIKVEKHVETHYETALTDIGKDQEAHNPQHVVDVQAFV